MSVSKPTTINTNHFLTKAHVDLNINPVSKSLWLEIPAFCHLNCSYCFASAERCSQNKSDEYYQRSQEQLNRYYYNILDQFAASEYQGKYLGIPGNGEPFHPRNRDLTMSILKRAKELGITTTVFTTADAIFYDLPGGEYKRRTSVDIDKKYAELLFDMDVILLVKFNSQKDDIQDGIVGQPGYTQARNRAMKALFDMGFNKESRRLGIVTSILEENKLEIISLFEYAQENNLIFDCDTILPRGNGKSYRDIHKLGLEDATLKTIYKDLAEASGDNFAAGGSYVGVACDRVKHHLYIDIEGNVYPCIGCVDKPFDLILGNVNENTLLDCWNNPIRKQIREDYEKIVTGPCSWCNNFQVSCWSCLGRVVEKCTRVDDYITLHTEGCFCHNSNYTRWLRACSNFVRTCITLPGKEGFKNLHKTTTGQLKNSDMEIFWENGLNDHPFLKDITFSSLQVLGSSNWRLIDLENVFSNIRDFQAVFRSILPRVLIPSMYNLIEQYDVKFEPSSDLKNITTADTGKWGLIQFCLFMFYMPSEKQRYFYRTLSCNSLDPQILSSPHSTYEITKNELDLDSCNVTFIHRNRRILLLQRWAEAYENGFDKAPLLPMITNLSSDFEDKHITSYELILSNRLFEAERNNIDRDILVQKRHVLFIGDLLDMPVIQDKVNSLSVYFDAIVTDDKKWNDVAKGISSTIFASNPSEVEALRTFYDGANNQLFPTNDSGTVELNNLIAKVNIVLKNILLKHSRIQNSFLTDKDLHNEDIKFIIELSKKHQHIEYNGDIPDWAKSNNPVEQIQILTRLKDPILFQFILLFVNEEIKSQSSSIKALNYFVWLGYLKKVLNIEAYTVLHTPNFLLMCQQALNMPFKKIPSSGMIISSIGRLPKSMIEESEEVFSSILYPLEEIIGVQTVYPTAPLSETDTKNTGKQPKLKVIINPPIKHE
ncbi:MAG: hypothetical protein CVU48_01545 [Candidatus Cloacimonetes bacterium HGW-Cloacimonetes-1]|jgi:radical SAM protein with 4Fe4S-binding SPASM domain|nr:MAG: hypothetical protein CVU48_01545 [Candidatus Cloacimonetes bacterium HGW-Cloacimonetes-1]